MAGFQRRENLRVVDSPAPGEQLVKPDPAHLAIECRDAFLSYPLGAFARGSLKSTMLSLFGHRSKFARPQFVNALNGINLQISQGERVGIIGHNGSGKSTLLRTLAGIYPLAGGEITVMGRIGTLLDISLGFEPESTGRENIYYRGMTMGYSRKKLREVEQEIVEFAGLGEFIDLPMHTYSTGMYVRLGFAISTHFSPDILLVDEVFGAGDASFERRALDRMMQIISHSGIFVIASHSLPLIEMVCQRAIWLDRGKVVRDGPVATIAEEYRKHMSRD